MAEWRGKLRFSDFFQSSACTLHCVAGLRREVWDREQEKDRNRDKEKQRDTGRGVGNREGKHRPLHQEGQKGHGE